jgi:hypothetical protein
MNRIFSIAIALQLRELDTIDRNPGSNIMCFVCFFRIFLRFNQVVVLTIFSYLYGKLDRKTYLLFRYTFYFAGLTNTGVL